MAKRVFDLFLFTILIIPLALVILLICLFIYVIDGRPVFYTSERMKKLDEPFMLFKFRTMKPDQADYGVSGADKTERITKTGGFLRRHRLDEIPQIINVAKGDLSFVGPRPPLRVYVEKHPDVYCSVLQIKPGVTGLASILFHKHEEWILSQCTSKKDTDLTYSRRCVNRKAEIDKIYIRNQSFIFDLYILYRTFVK